MARWFGSVGISLPWGTRRAVVLAAALAVAMPLRVEAQLFAGVDDANVDFFDVDPDDDVARGLGVPGVQIWGATADTANERFLVTDGSRLYEIPFTGGSANLLATIHFGASSISAVSLAMKDGELLFTRNVSESGVDEGLHKIRLPGGEVELLFSFPNPNDIDVGGLGVDPATGKIYGSNDDDSFPEGRGIVEIDPIAQTTTLVAPYPDGETDIDGLAVGDGKIFLVTDQPGNFYVFDIATGTYLDPLTSPFTTSEVFSGAAYVERDYRVVGGRGADPAGIQAAVDRFRADLGTNNGAVVGSQGTGRREINWDDVSDDDADPNPFPKDLFNTTSPRGVELVGPIFRVSADSMAAATAEFGDLNPGYPTAFAPFSDERLLAPIAGNFTFVDFFVPGENRRASVSAFAAVFADVDQRHDTTIELFDRHGNMIFERDVPPATSSDGGLSFVGVQYDEGAPIAYVRLKTGTAAPGPNDVTQGGTEDIVVLDDFIYGEPVLIANTSTIGAYDPLNGAFFLRNENSDGPADHTFFFGPANAGWTPVTGDWDGNPTSTAGLYDPVNGAFFLRNAHANGPADETFFFGPAGQGWVPVSGDWDGDGTDTVGLYDPANGAFFLRNAHANGPADETFFFGPAGQGWIPVAGDWNANGTDTVGLHDPANAGFFLRNAHANGPADFTFFFGHAGQGWIPLAGDWDGL